MTSGWQSSLDVLARERYGALVGFARVLGAGDDAQDLVQEALISTFSRQRRFASPGHAERYVRRAIASRLIDAARARTSRSHRERAAAPAEALRMPDHPLDFDLEAGLRALSPQQRACVVLRFLEDLSTAQTAESLGLSVGSVKRYVHEGVDTLRGILGVEISPPTSDVVHVDVRRRHA